jgi:hypothetical protein
LPKDGKVLSHLEFNSKVLPLPFSDLSIWVGWDSVPQVHSRVSNIDFWYLDFGGSYKYPMKNCQRTAKFFPTWGLIQRYCPGFIWIQCLGGILHLQPTAGCQICTLIFEFWVGPNKYPMNNCQRTEKFIPSWGLNQRYCPGRKSLDV